MSFVETHERNPIMKHLLVAVAACILVLSLAGCATTVTTQNPSPANRSQVFAYTPEDIDRAVETWMDDLMRFGPVATSTEPPLVGFCGIANRGRDPNLDMLQFQRAFEYFGIRTGKMRFTAATNLPDSFFEQHKFQKSMVADKDTSVKIGKIQGWKYSIYGELFQKREPDAKGNMLDFYDVYVYMINIETAEQVWNSRQKFVLNRNKKAVGW
jgi:hypothetical protein